MCAFVSCVLIHLPWFHNRALTLTDNSGQTDMFLGQQKCPIAPPQLIRQLLSSTMIDNSAICMMLLTGCLYFCMLVGVLWFRNRALTSKDNSGQTDMFLGQHKCPIAPPQRAPS